MSETHLITISDPPIERTANEMIAFTDASNHARAFMPLPEGYCALLNSTSTENGVMVRYAPPTRMGYPFKKVDFKLTEILSRGDPCIANRFVDNRLYENGYVGKVANINSIPCNTCCKCGEFDPSLM